MTTEYYQVEEAANGGNFWALYNDQLTLAKAIAVVKMRRRRADGNWQYRIVRVTETREIVDEKRLYRQLGVALAIVKGKKEVQP
jgi:hypothetical protein